MQTVFRTLVDTTDMRSGISNPNAHSNYNGDGFSMFHF